MKGIILAAGKGTRMYPMTLPVCKPLLAVYDKPLLYYPLATLLMAGIRDILIIVPPDEMYPFIKLLGDGSELGISLSYRVQRVQRGIADAFRIGRSFIGTDSVCLVLGDNIFYGEGLAQSLRQAARDLCGASVFGYRVRDPRPFGVIEFDGQGRAVSIEEKPEHPRSDYIIPGLYFYDGSVAELAAGLTPSARGELEITDLNNLYLAQGRLRVTPLGSDIVWHDAGNADSLLSAAAAIRDTQAKTGLQVACIEEIAWRMGYIGSEQLRAAGLSMQNTRYGSYILSLLSE